MAQIQQAGDVRRSGGDLGGLFDAAVGQLEERLRALEEWRASCEDANADGPIAARVSKAAKLVGLSRSQMYALVRSGEVPSIKLGGVLLVPLQSMRRRLERP